MDNVEYAWRRHDERRSTGWLMNCTDVTRGTVVRSDGSDDITGQVDENLSDRPTRTAREIKDAVKSQLQHGDDSDVFSSDMCAAAAAVAKEMGRRTQTPVEPVLAQPLILQSAVEIKSLTTTGPLSRPFPSTLAQRCLNCWADSHKRRRRCVATVRRVIIKSLCKVNRRFSSTLQALTRSVDLLQPSKIGRHHLVHN